MIRNTLIFLLLGLVWAQADVTRPNVLLVLIDDMGPMDTSVPFLADAQGEPEKHPLNEFYHTPEMEKLAAQGFRSSRFYANSVCSPTRASLMNGQSAARHRTTQWIRPEGRNREKHAPADWNWSGLGKEDLTLPRLHLKKDDERFELFDLKEDPYELENLASSHPGLLKDMRALMAEDLLKVDAQVPEGVDIKAALVE